MPDAEDIHPADGGELVVRSIQPGDRSLLAAFVDKLSPSSRYRRFLGPKESLAEGELTWFTDLDHHDREALIALDGDELVAVARYIRLEDRPQVAEVAVTVADDWQLRGVGTALLGGLIERAKDEGVTTFVASCLADNVAMIALLRDLGQSIRKIGGGAGVLEFEMDLG